MKKQTRTIIIVLLNVLFCAYMLWFSARNTYLRPYAGSTTRELLAGLILLVTLYTNYFLLYPKHPFLQRYRGAHETATLAERTALLRHRAKIP